MRCTAPTRQGLELDENPLQTTGRSRAQKLAKLTGDKNRMADYSKRKNLTSLTFMLVQLLANSFNTSVPQSTIHAMNNDIRKRSSSVKILEA